MDITLYSSTGQKKEALDLKTYLGDAAWQGRTLHEVIVGYQRNARQGTSSTKTRGLVRGGGRKPWKQKGTGNARSGSIRSPLWRKGGIIFGPLPRSYRIDLPEEKRRAALSSALWLKVKEGSVIALEVLDASLSKAKKAAELLAKLPLQDGCSLIVSDQISLEQRRAFSNLPRVALSAAQDLNALDVMNSRHLVLTVPALQTLSRRLSGGAHA